MIWRTSDNQNLRIYSTTFPTGTGLYTLLQDPQYRLALAWQNVGYNQPPHPSFYLGHDMETPSQPDIAIVEPDIAPIVQITSPTVGQELGLGITLNVTLNALGFTDTTTVYLRDGDEQVGSIDSRPYVITLSSLASGVHPLVAWAYDEDMNMVESATVTIVVDQGFLISL